MEGAVPLGGRAVAHEAGLRDTGRCAGVGGEERHRGAHGRLAGPELGKGHGVRAARGVGGGDDPSQAEDQTRGAGDVAAQRRAGVGPAAGRDDPSVRGAGVGVDDGAGPVVCAAGSRSARAGPRRRRRGSGDQAQPGAGSAPASQGARREGVPDDGPTRRIRRGVDAPGDHLATGHSRSAVGGDGCAAPAGRRRAAAPYPGGAGVGHRRA